MKFRYNVGCYWMKECALSKYKNRAEQTLSCHLPNSTKGHILPYHDMSRDENPQRENKMDSLSFESFHAQLCKLTYSNKITEVSPLKKWREILDYVSCFSLLFFCTLASSCMLYKSTEHSQGFSIC